MTTLERSPLAFAPCLHCGHSNTQGSAFCGSCGKALPTPGAAPRIVEDSQFAATHVGQSMQLELLAKQARSASVCLLLVACVQALIAVVVGMLLMEEAGPIVAVILGGIAAVFFGLFAWSLRNPLPACVCGLVIYVSLHALNALADPTTIAEGIIWKVLIISVLAKGISAGIKHRELSRRITHDGAN
jgi:hypothetical protein